MCGVNNVFSSGSGFHGNLRQYMVTLTTFKFFMSFDHHWLFQQGENKSQSGETSLHDLCGPNPVLFEKFARREHII